jgi:hypothetical protein
MIFVTTGIVTCTIGTVLCNVLRCCHLPFHHAVRRDGSAEAILRVTFVSRRKALSALPHLHNRNPGLIQRKPNSVQPVRGIAEEVQGRGHSRI